MLVIHWQGTLCACIEFIQYFLICCHFLYFTSLLFILNLTKFHEFSDPHLHPNFTA